MTTTKKAKAKRFDSKKAIETLTEEVAYAHERIDRLQNQLAAIQPAGSRKLWLLFRESKYPGSIGWYQIVRADTPGAICVEEVSK